MAMKRPNEIEAPRTAPISNVILSGLIVWSLILACSIGARGNLNLGHYLNRWIDSPFALVPSLPALTGHLKRIGALLGLTFVLIFSGRSALRLARIISDNVWEELALSMGLGYGIWGTGLLILGLTGAWRRPIFFTLVIASFILAVADRIRRRALHAPNSAQVFRSRTALDRVYVAALVLVTLYVLRYALIPETFFDALQYHLALPSLYIERARIFATPENSYSGIPALPQMLYGLTLAFDKWGITASVLHWSMSLWCAVALIGLSVRLKRPEAGFLAAAAFCLTPVAIGESFRVSVGLEWAFLELCMLTALLAALSKKRGTTERIGWLTLCGVFMGFAMSTKYPAWLLPLALIPAMLLTDSSRPAAEKNEPLAKISMKECGIVIGIAGLCLSPWIVKNILFYHNPLYPFFQELFAPGSPYMPDWRQINTGGRDYGALFTMRGLLHYASHP
jgi:hypothetical protein